MNHFNELKLNSMILSEFFFRNQQIY
jgi:hypothetical protein